MKVRRSFPRISKIDSRTIETRIKSNAYSTKLWPPRPGEDLNIDMSANSPTEPPAKFDQPEVTKSCVTSSYLLLLRMLPRKAISFRAESLSSIPGAARPVGQVKVFSEQVRLH